MEYEIFPAIATGTLTPPCGTPAEVTVAIHASATKLVAEVINASDTCRVSAGARCRFIGRVLEGGLATGERIGIDPLHLSRKRSRRSLRGALFEPSNETVIGMPTPTCVSLARSVATTLPEVSGVEIGPFVLAIHAPRSDSVETLLHEASKHADRIHSTIVLAGPSLPAEQYEEAMQEVTTLIGIILSHSPFTSQTIRTCPSGTRSRHIRFDGGLGVGSSKTVCSGCHAECLHSAWRTWSSLDEDFRRAMRISSTYLAASCEGYLDTQLFSTFQAWEGLAKAYVKRFRDASDLETRETHAEALDELAARLQATHDAWASEFTATAVSPIENFAGLIASTKRIKTQDAVDYLLERTGLDVERAGLDVVSLRRATNKVRHTGMLPPKEEYLSDFYASGARSSPSNS